MLVHEVNCPGELRDVKRFSSAEAAPKTTTYFPITNQLTSLTLSLGRSEIIFPELYLNLLFDQLTPKNGITIPTSISGKISVGFHLM